MAIFGFQDTVNELLKENIKLHSSIGEPQSNLIYSVIHEFINSDFFKQGEEATNYYFNKANIINKKREIINKSGLPEETKLLANTKKQHNYLYKLVKQKRSFLLSKPFTVTSDLDLKIEANNQYMDEINKIFNKQTREFIQSVVTDAMLYSIGWIQYYYDENGELKYKKIPSLEVIPFWRDAEHRVLDAIIRMYEIENYKEDGTKEIIKKIEFYDESGIWYYVEDNRKLIPDPDKYKDNELIQPYPNFYQEKIKVDEYGQPLLDSNDNAITETEGKLFNNIPFIPIKYNSDEIALLPLVKSLVDEYNNKTSLCGDILQDCIHEIMKVRGYSGKDAEAFVHNVNALRVIFLQADGDVDKIKSEIDIMALDSYLDRTKEDIYDLSMSVNTQAENLKAASGVSLDLRFRDLILDCTDLGGQVELAIIQMINNYNIDKIARGEMVPVTEFSVIFNMDMPTDETSVISNVTKSIGTISKKTALSNHPWVKDVDEELEAVGKEEQEAIDLEVERMEKLNYDEI